MTDHLPIPVRGCLYIPVWDEQAYIDHLETMGCEDITIHPDDLNEYYCYVEYTNPDDVYIDPDNVIPSKTK